jgi:radical SAM superfamily enzyme YgiQ (UPF0313 family)
MGKIIGMSFPRNDGQLGLEPSVLNVLPQGENVEYDSENHDYNDGEVEKYVCSVYIAGMKEFKSWARRHDAKKIVVGGYHPTMFPEDFLPYADKVVMGPCDDLETTLSQKEVQFERGYYDGTQIGNSRFIPGRILRSLDPVKGWKRIHGEVMGNPEKPSAKSKILEGRVLPGVLTFRNLPRFDLYAIRNNQQIIPDKMSGDLSTSVNSSFGCPYKCEFCCTPPMFGDGLISKPMDAFAREVDFIGGRLKAADDGTQPKYLFIRDENFTLQRDYRERLEKIGETEAKVYLFASANTLSEKVADALADNGVYMVCLGLEDPTKEYAKNKQLGEAVSRLKDRGIYTYLSFIVDPLEVVGAEKGERFYEALNEKFDELKPEMVCGNFLMPFPGTPLWDKFYHLISEDDFQHYDSKTPFLVKNPVVAAKMAHFMFDAQWKYFTSDMYNNQVRKFDTGDTLHLRFLELKDRFDQRWEEVKHLRP